MKKFHVALDHQHLAWDNSLPPVLIVEPGSEIEIVLADASGGQILRSDDASAVERLDFNAVNPCTGPISIDGAEPGDDLVVSILDVSTREWTWTANIPGFGLLADVFPEAHLWISNVRDGVITTPLGVEIEARPMIGTIGVAPAAAGATPLLVPTNAGGNMDIAQIGAGTTLHLPVRVPGALLSAGDAHAVQGDGEVCGTGAETSAILQVRVDLAKDVPASAPWFEHSARSTETDWIATTGIGPDLFVATREATLRAVELIARQTRMDPIDAYLLLSLVGELRISEVVDAPNWVVTLHVPTRYTRG